MCKFIYRWLAETKSSTYDLKIKDAINTIEKYGEWDRESSDSVVPCGGTVEIHGNAFFKREKDGKSVYDIFYDNLHIHVSVTETEKIYSIRIKKPDEYWTCVYDTNSMRSDFSHPINEYYEVYVWYLVPVLDITKSDGYVYKHGTWDKYVYRTMESFFADCRGEMDVSKFNNYYKQWKK